MNSLTPVDLGAARRIELLTGTDTAPFSLSATCGPVAWSRGRWPNLDWTTHGLVWVGWEGERVVWRAVRQTAGDELSVLGPASPTEDLSWAERVLGIAGLPPRFDDPVVEALWLRYPGMRPFSAGSLFDGLVTSIVGQSITIAAAAVTESRLTALFVPGVEIGERAYRPLPRADQLANASAELVRRSGVTWRRAEALVAAGRAEANGELPSTQDALDDPDRARALLRQLPLVGPWTAESALLWGVGSADVYPSGDVALLRAARGTYGDAGLSAKALDRLSEGWRPYRGWAARLLWTDLLGTAPVANERATASV